MIEINKNCNALIYRTLYMGGGVKANSRAFGLDLVRAFAIFSVIGGHFFTLHTSFRTTPMEGISMFIQSIAQSIFSSGVPLFLILTGYLNINKEVSRKYYSGIWRVIAAYLFFSVVTLLFRHFYMGEVIKASECIMSILRFDAILYGWYIEMWIGLFLLIPFLNIVYRNLPSRRQKLLLLAVVCTISFAPTFTNRYGLHLLPDFWKDSYPITYYFIGAYIREYSLKIRLRIAQTVILAVGCIPPLFTMLIMEGHPQISILGDCFGIFGAASAIMIFLVLYKIKCTTPWIERPVYWISLLSLDMYLCSYIFDSLIYPWFKTIYFVDQSSFAPFFFIIVPAVFMCSFTLSLAKRMLFSLPILRQVK